MSNSKTLAAAALIGLLSAGAMTVNAYAADDSVQATGQKSIEKHACKGQNSCKGNGGGDACALRQKLLQRSGFLRNRWQQISSFDWQAVRQGWQRPCLILERPYSQCNPSVQFLI